MKLTEKINFRQPKYMLPAILYIPILFLGFFVIRLFGTEKAEVDKSNLETTQDVASGAMSQSMSLNDGSATSSLGRWGMQALQNAYQKTANAISKNIRKNKVNIKYGTQVYLINSKEKRQTK